MINSFIQNEIIQFACTVPVEIESDDQIVIKITRPSNKLSKLIDDATKNSNRADVTSLREFN